LDVDIHGTRPVEFTLARPARRGKALERESREILVGTRASELALSQTKWAVGQLAAARPDRAYAIRTVTTAGDRFAEEAIPNIGTGVFTKEIERNLLNRTLDMAVHSLKDLPTAQPEGLAVAAVLEREDPRDALVSRNGTKLADLPQGARVGTGSIRRAAQLRAFRSDLDIISMRGNVPTRLAKLDSMGLDAIVLAAAGLKRLGRGDSITETLEPDMMLPAAAQGIVAIEARASSTRQRGLRRWRKDSSSTSSGEDATRPLAPWPA
jgi:hydroxymethylbilane synthase